MNKTIVILTCILILNCKFVYERSNPLDPDYEGGKTRIISIDSYTLEDYNPGNNDGFINRGESIKIYITIKNLGNTIAEGVRTDISCSNTNITIEPDNWDVLTWGNVEPGEISEGLGQAAGLSTYRAKAYTIINIDNNTPENENFSLIFSFYDALDNRNGESLDLIVNKTRAILILDNITVRETVPDVSYKHYEFKQNIKNIGTSSTQDVWSIASIPDTLVQLSFGGWRPVSYGDIAAGEVNEPTFPYSNYRIPITLQLPHTFQIKHDIYDTYGNHWYDSTYVTIN